MRDLKMIEQLNVIVQRMTSYFGWQLPHLRHHDMGTFRIITLYEQNQICTVDSPYKVPVCRALMISSMAGYLVSSSFNDIYQWSQGCIPVKNTPRLQVVDGMWKFITILWPDFY